MTPDGTLIYRPTGQYALLTAFGAAAALFCAWALWRQFDWITLIFMVGCLYAAAIFANQWAARVELDRHGLQLRTPLRRQRVEFRQIDSAAEAGRIARGIVVTYHPLTPDGLLDLDTLHSVALPAVEDQETLLAALQARRLRIS